jgi:hypothetical protein
MTAVLGVLAAAAALAGPPALDPDQLPKLPQRGLARETVAGVELQTLRGRRLGLLTGFQLAPDKAVSHSLVLRSRRGPRLFTLDVYKRRVRRFFEGPSSVPTCRLTDARLKRELFACGSTIRTVTYGPPGSRPQLRVVARAPAEIGHWVWAEFAPRGPAFLAQWSAECEVPVAYLVAGGKLRAYAEESVALGWLPSGDALVHFPNGPCAGGWRPVRGIYAVRGSGSPRLLLRTPRFAQYAMWGG